MAKKQYIVLSFILSCFLEITRVYVWMLFWPTKLQYISLKTFVSAEF